MKNYSVKLKLKGDLEVTELNHQTIWTVAWLWLLCFDKYILTYNLTMKMKLKILEHVNFSFFMFYLLVFELCPQHVLGLSLFTYITLHYPTQDVINQDVHVIIQLTSWRSLCADYFSLSRRWICIYKVVHTNVFEINHSFKHTRHNVRIMLIVLSHFQYIRLNFHMEGLHGWHVQVNYISRGRGLYVIYTPRAEGPRLYKSHRDQYRVIQPTCTMGYVPVTMHPGLVTIASAIKGSSAYLATIQTSILQQTVVEPVRMHGVTVQHRVDAIFPSNSSFLLNIQNHSTILLCKKGRKSAALSMLTRSNQLQQLSY